MSQDSPDGKGRPRAAEHSKEIRKEEYRMCGIVGYIGTEQAAPIILDGLSKLEYRGYDSAGMALSLIHI